MTLTERKGNIRGREFPTDTGIDGNAWEETTKDQRWVGLCRQIPDPDTRPTSLVLSLLLPEFPSLSPLVRSPFLSLSLSSRINSLHLVSSPDVRPFVRTTRSTAHTHRHTATLPLRGATNFHDGYPLGCSSSWKRSRRRTTRDDLLHSRPVVL